MRLIVGFGKTGESVARFFDQLGKPYRVVAQPEDKARLATLTHLDQVHYFPFQPQYIDADCSECILSPGINPEMITPTQPDASAVTLVNDIELFFREAKAPIIAVTGTNGKSTVVNLLTEMISASGKVAYVGGNVGVPALDLLQLPTPDYYVLELSSYQIELLQQFQCQLAIVLNIAPDHLARHKTFERYREVKLSLLSRAAQTLPCLGPDECLLGMGGRRYHVVSNDNGYAICQGETILVTSAEMVLSAKHDMFNAMYCLVACDTLAIPRAPAITALCQFQSLEHRCERVASNDGVCWINDSKATNIAACLSALRGSIQQCTGTLYLILGGQPKGECYQELIDEIRRYAVSVCAFGEMTASVTAAGSTAVTAFDSLAQVVACLKTEVVPGDLVLFSPGGASFDQFDNFEHRGRVFKALVQGGGDVTG